MLNSAGNYSIQREIFLEIKNSLTVALIWPASSIIKNKPASTPHILTRFEPTGITSISAKLKGIKQFVIHVLYKIMRFSHRL